MLCVCGVCFVGVCGCVCVCKCVILRCVLVCFVFRVWWVCACVGLCILCSLCGRNNLFLNFAYFTKFFTFGSF